MEKYQNLRKATESLRTKAKKNNGKPMKNFGNTTEKSLGGVWGCFGGCFEVLFGRGCLGSFLGSKKLENYKKKL